MADIPLYEDDSDSILESEASYDEYESDAGLTMLERLQKYCNNENMYTRQMVTRSLLETIRTIENEEEAEAFLKAITTLADDSEAMVRSELMEHIPHIGVFCLENLHIFGDPIPKHLLPIVVKYITDQNNQARKTSHAALLVLLEQGMIQRGDVESQVCPVILELAQPTSNDDFRTEAAAPALMSLLTRFDHQMRWQMPSSNPTFRLSDKETVKCYGLLHITACFVEQLAGIYIQAVAASLHKQQLMCKLAPLIGKEATERLFLDRFANMCTDALFHVRKVCATNFGDMCQVVGRENTEEVLLNKFFYLCEDGVWGVRKACAECFMQVSCICSPEIRRTELVQVFSNLICDQSRWVRMAAFQALGGFISTFADPSNTGLYVGDNGNLVVGKPEDFPKEIRPEISESNNSSNTSICDNTSSEPTSAISVATSVITDTEADSSSNSPVGLGRSDTDQNSSTEAGLVSSALLPSMTLVCDDGSDKDAEASLQQLHLDVSVEEVRAESSEITGNDKGDDDDSSVDASSDHQTTTPQVTDDSSTAPSDNPTNDVSKCPVVPVVEDSMVTLAGRVHASPSSQTESSNSTEYNNFQYWRMPIPEIDVTVDQSKKSKSDNIQSSTNVSSVTTKGDSTCLRCGPSDSEAECQPSISEDDEMEKGSGDGCGPIYTASVQTVCETVEEVANFGSTHVVGQHVSERTTAMKGDAPGVPPEDNEDLDTVEDLFLPDQDVIPQMLLDHYLSMVDPSRAQTVDSEIARHCAYSFPAVAYTLGRKYWPCLKELYEKLAHDMQLKVRRTLAFSIHELAVILGEEITSRDLVPVFNCFLRDLDEVRVGVLKHLGDFLKLLKPEARQEYLTKIDKFLNTDNTRNWRFREELALQLASLLELYSPKDISEHLVPVAILLTEDPVSAVRCCAFRVLSAMVGCLNDAGDNEELVSLIQDIKERFALSSSSGKRQMYVYISHSILEDNSLSREQFATELLPMLLNLAEDSIPNVRIALSRTISKYIMNSEYFTSVQNPLQEKLLNVIEKLKSDSEYDVRYFLVPMLTNTDIASDIIPV